MRAGGGVGSEQCERGGDSVEVVGEGDLGEGDLWADLAGVEIGYRSVDIEHMSHGEAADLGTLKLFPGDAIAHGAETLQGDDREEEPQRAGHEGHALEVGLADDEAFDAFAMAADQGLGAGENVEGDECRVKEYEGAHDGGRRAGLGTELAVCIAHGASPKSDAGEDGEEPEWREDDELGDVNPDFGAEANSHMDWPKRGSVLCRRF